MLRTVLICLSAALGLAACGSNSLAVGDCTDVDPTFVIEAVEPEKVDCGSEDAGSKVAAVEDSQEACQTEAVIKQGETYYCLEPQGKTFREELDETVTTGTDLEEAVDELEKELEDTQTAP